MTRSAIILTLDRLQPAFLGPYGGTWTCTPNFDRLAAQSLVVEYAIIDSPDLNLVFRSYWQGVHACVSRDKVVPRSVVQTIGEAAIRTLLVTDDPQVAAHPLTELFSERVQLPQLSGEACAAEVEDTQIAQSLAAAMDVLTELREPFMLWIHLRGLAAPWDAPLELRERVRGEDDPQPTTDARVPSLRLDDEYDPDQLLGIMQAYAAQVMLLDMGLGVLLEAIDSHPARNELLLVVTSPRGFPLGEHLLVGDAETALYGELLQVPLLVRCGDRTGYMAREQALAQPADIAATLADWFTLPHAAPSPQAASLLALMTDAPLPWPRVQTLSVTGGERATRTLAWFLRQRSASVELFNKPDDRFEANEISSLCPAVVEQLSAAAAALEQAYVDGDFSHLAPLSPELIEGAE